MNATHAFARIGLREIRIGNRLRAAERDVTDLAESMKTRGQIYPILVRDRAEGGFELIAGRHRLKAAQQLGWDAVAAYVYRGCDDLHAELLQIDENLIRKDLTAADRSKHLARRAELYEVLHPETKHGGTGRGRDRDADSATLSFVADTAKKTGMPASTIAKELQIGRNLAPDVMEAVAASPLADEKTKLLELSRLDHDEQREVIGVMDRARQEVKDAVDKDKAVAKKIKAEIESRKRRDGESRHRSDIRRRTRGTVARKAIPKGVRDLERVAIALDLVEVHTVPTDEPDRKAWIKSLTKSIASIQRVLTELER